MEFIGAKEAAEKWGVNVRIVQGYCSKGKIPGTKRVGNKWIIPADASKPTDGRSKEGKRTKLTPKYHFPVFVHSKFYLTHEDLSIDELRLINAQFLHLEGDYKKSIAICKTIIKGTEVVSVKVGAYATIAYSSLLLGLISEAEESILAINDIAKEDKEHEEDYNLISAAVYFQYTLNTERLFQINSLKLSDDARPALIYALLMSEIANTSSISKSTRMMYKSFCLHLEALKILPTLVVCHAILGYIAFVHNEPAEMEYHIDQSVKIGIEKGWYTLLSKSYSMFPAEYSKGLLKHGQKYLNTVKARCEKNMRNMQMAFQSRQGNSNLFDEYKKENS